MAAKPEVIMEWANGEYLFALRMAQIEALEAECSNPETGKLGIGFASIFTRVMGSSWYLADLMNIIRHGLIGGGMDALSAHRLVRDYASTVPVSSLNPGVGANSPLSVAQAILASAMVGVEDQDGKKEMTPEDE